MHHEGAVLARSTSRAGAQVPVWLDRHGELASPPANRLNAVLDDAAIAAVVPMLGGGTIAAAWIGLHRMIVGYNMRVWEREWARVGPDWSNQQPK